MTRAATREGRAPRFPAGTGAALFVLAVGLGVVLLRPPLPIDETRYLEVFRESLQGSPLLLRLLGEPYAEKPPLLFWLGRLLAALSIPPESALRSVPAIASALTALLVARIGKRAGVEHAAWMQAALWLPSLAGQFLFFDSLLALTIWGAVDAWIRLRDAEVWLWSAAALLAKGPVAYLFLIPLLWSTAGLRPAGGAVRGRTLLLLSLALVPLAAWALSAASLGGPEFANALLWERWAGRIVRSADHAGPLYFYVPVALIGALPATLILFTRRTAAAPAWSIRLAKSLVFFLVAFTLISGKRAHYLVPAAPALALVMAEASATRPAAGARLWLGLRIQLGLVACACVVGVFLLPQRIESFGSQGLRCIESRLYLLPLGLSALIVLAGLVRTWRLHALGARLRTGAISAGLGLLPFHWLAGQLLFPHDLARTLANAPGAIAFWGNGHHGIYALLASSTELEKLPNEASIAPWLEAHPAGTVLISDRLELDLPATIEIAARDVVHRSAVQVLRKKSG